MYTKGDWKVREWNNLKGFWIETSGGSIIASVEKPMGVRAFPVGLANARLISAAPIGYELSDFIIMLSATRINEGLREIGKGDYLRMKELALKFWAKAEGKDANINY